MPEYDRFMPVSTKTSGRYALTRPPRDNDELYSLVKALWGVTVPRYSVCPEHCAPFDWFSDSFFARQPQTIALGSRGLSGKSYGMSVLGLTNAVVWGADVNLLGGSLSQSVNLHEAMRNAWEYENSPSYMLVDETALRIRLSNGSRIRPLTASQKTVRGPHPARLQIDEVDEVDYPILQAAFGQPMPQRNWMNVLIPAQTAMTSTWQYPDGTMMKELRRFEDAGMQTHSWCYRESMNPHDGWLSQEFVEQKKKEIPREMWRVEYELGEPSIGNRAFDTESVERTFTTEMKLPDPIKLTRSHEEYKIEDYNPSEDYVIAADWAQSQDFTVITVWKVTNLPMTLVYYVRINRQPYPKMISIFNQLQKKYRADGIHDATGLGGVVKDLIDGRVWNFQMTGMKRDDMLTEYVAAVENDRVRAPRIRSMFDETRYASVEDLYSRAKEYHLPDSVCSAALAWKVAGRRYPEVAPVGLPKMENWMSTAVEHNRQLTTAKDGGLWKVDGEVTTTEQDMFSFS